MKKIFLGPGAHLIIPVIKKGKRKRMRVNYGYWFDTETGKQLSKATWEEYELAINASRIKAWIDRIYYGG